MNNSSIKNVVLITIDSLRYDRLGYVTGNTFTTPAIDHMAEHGISCDNAFSHACPTQMSMPSLFTSTLPLDHGGYDTICQRPCTIAEKLKNMGFRTIGLNSGTAMSSFYGYDRGFDEYHDLFSLDCFFFAYRKLYCEYYFELFVNKVISEDQFVSIMSKKIEDVFDYFESYCKNMLDYIKDKSVVLDRVLTETAYEEILNKVRSLRKTVSISPGEYIMNNLEHFQVTPRTYSKEKHLKDLYDFLTIENSTSVFKQVIFQNLMIEKILNRIPSRFKKNNKRYYGRLNDDRIVQNAVRILSKFRSGKNFLWMHLSDVHFSLNNYQLLQLPHWIMKRKKEVYTHSDPYYDLSVHSTDNRIKNLFDESKKAGLIDSTLFIITSDHGHKAGYPKRGVGLGSASFHDEFLHIPLIFYNPSLDPRRITNLASTLDIGPTILDILGEHKVASFLGRSLINPNYSEQPEIICEHLHRGPCDIDRKPVYLCVRTKRYKLIWREYIYEKDTQNDQYELYDLTEDSGEKNNRFNDKELTNIQDELMKIALNRYGIIRSQRGIISEAVS